MKYKIVKYGDPILTKKSRPITEFNEYLATLTEDMFETMYANQGIGLAAPQIGVNLQVAVVDTSSGASPEKRIVLVNPKIVMASQEDLQPDDEGCLSMPGFLAKVSRPRSIKVEARNITGGPMIYSGVGLSARAILHEIDHLNGILFIDHLPHFTQNRIKATIQRLQKSSEWENNP